MDQPRRPSDLSDGELVALMREHLADRRWPISQLVEVERRGLDVLDPDPELRAAVQAQLDERTARIRAMIAHASPDWIKFSEHLTPAWSEQIREQLSLAELSVQAALDGSSLLDQPLDSPEVRHQEQIAVLRAGFGDVVTGVTALAEKSPPRWVAYAVLVVSTVAMIAAIAGVVLTRGRS